MDAFLAAALRPFFVLLILTVFGIPITYAIKRWMVDGKLKRFLLDTSWERDYPLLPLLGMMLIFLWIGYLGR